MPTENINIYINGKGISSQLKAAGILNHISTAASAISETEVFINSNKHFSTGKR